MPTLSSMMAVSLVLGLALPAAAETSADGIAWRRPNQGADWIAFDGGLTVLVRPESKTAEVIDVATGKTVAKDVVTGEQRSLFPSSLHLRGDLLIQQIPAARRTRDTDPWLRVVEARTGRLRFALPRRFESLDDEYLAIGRSDGMLVIADANPYDHKTKSAVVGLQDGDGVYVWRRTFSTSYVHALVAAGDRTLIHTDEALVALRVKSGEPLWTADRGYGVTTLLVDGDRIVYRGGKDNLALRSLSDGRLLATLPLADGPGEPRLLHGNLLVLTGEDSVAGRESVLVMDLQTRKPLWKKQLASRYKGGRMLEIANGRLLVFSGWDVIRSLDLRTGDEAVPLGFEDIQQVDRVSKDGHDYLLVNTRAAGAFGQPGEFLAVPADAWPPPTDVTIAGCATIKVDKRLCRKPVVRVRVGDLTVPTDKKGCFEARLAARGFVPVQVDEVALLGACVATKKMAAEGEFPCSDNASIKVRILPGVPRYRADPRMAQRVCQDY